MLHEELYCDVYVTITESFAQVVKMAHFDNKNTALRSCCFRFISILSEIYFLYFLLFILFTSFFQKWEKHTLTELLTKRFHDVLRVSSYFSLSLLNLDRIFSVYSK